jgi:hypothetical protein
MPSVITLRFANNPSNATYIDIQPSAPGGGLWLDFVDSPFYPTDVQIGPTASTTLNNYFFLFASLFNQLGIYTIRFISSTDLEIEHPDSGFFDLGQVQLSSDPNVEAISVVDTSDETAIEGAITGQAVLTGTLTNAGNQTEGVITGQAVLTGTLTNVGDGIIQMQGSTVGQAVVTGTLTGLYPFDKKRKGFNIVSYKKRKYNIVNYQSLDKTNKNHFHGGL